MPTYEYECTSCGQHIEVYQRITEDPLSTCGACGGALRKVFHPAGIVFKGSGFYATDSRSGSKAVSKPKREDGSSPSSSSSDSGSGSGSSSDSGTSGSGGSSSSAPSKEPSAS
jgi:putative FmdB family regulatory protein